MRRTSVARRVVVIAAVCGMTASLRAQCPDGTPPPCAAAVAHPAPNSIAVLTFENTTHDSSAQYLAEGLADQILTRLGGVGRLTVVSRTVVRRLRNVDQLSVQQIGRALNAAYLVNGTIRAAGGRVRVSVEALRAASGEAIWSQTFDRSADSLLGIEEAVATEVAAGVAGRLSPQERRALGSRVTSNSRAYEQFLRGNVLMARRTRASLQAAIEAYRAATADSWFADAFARLSYAYDLCVKWGCGDVDSLLALARRATARALRLNPRSSDAWMARAYTAYLWSEHTTRTDDDDSVLASLAAFRRAVELNPRNDEAWHQFGGTLSFVSDSASIDALRRALALDPARAISYHDLSSVYALTGRMDRALELIDSAFALDPDGPYHTMRAIARLAAGDTAGAVADARSAPGSFAPVLAAFARDSASIRLMESVVAAHEFCSSGAEYLLWIGRGEEAVQRLIQCRPSIWTRFVLRQPALAPLADDPRIRALRAASDSVLARARWQ